jgi:hypothetical protein
MKYCPQCRKEYTETWITFCSDDGSILIEQFSPPGDPNWDPQIRTPTQSPSEQPTQWMPRPSTTPGGWVAPDERPPMRPAVGWQPPPAPMVSRQQSPSQGLAIASMITGILGLFMGFFCLGPIPGIVALILGLVSLSQIKKLPDKVSGKPFAIVGVVAGSLSLVFYGVLFLWVIISSIVFG